MDKDNMGSKEFFNLMGERRKHISISLGMFMVVPSTLFNLLFFLEFI